MSETFFHLLGPGTQPNDDSFSMNPLPITCQVNDEPSMAALEQCAHSPQVIALLNELQHQLSERQPPLGEVLAVDLLNLNADDRHFINTLLGEGEVSVRIQQADDSESEIQEAIFCGLWRAPQPTPAATPAPTPAPTPHKVQTLPQTGDGFPLLAIVVVSLASATGIVLLTVRQKNALKETSDEEDVDESADR